MKANSKIYKGIEYVVVSDLPADQQMFLEQRKIEQIKILMDGKIVSNCISYEAYSNWYHTIFKQRPPVSKPIQKDVPAAINIAFNKA